MTDAICSTAAILKLHSMPGVIAKHTNHLCMWTHITASVQIAACEPCIDLVVPSFTTHWYTLLFLKSSKITGYKFKASVVDMLITHALMSRNREWSSCPWESITGYHCQIRAEVCK